MEWNRLVNIKRFAPITNLNSNSIIPKFRLGEMNTYYLGNGFLLGFSDTKFRIEGSNRIEYGDKGEYALSIYYFQNKSELEKHFKLQSEQYEFNYSCINEIFEIKDGICIRDTFDKVTKLLRAKSKAGYYTEGETRSLNDAREFVFQNNFVVWNNIEFYFYGKSKKTKLTGFRYTLVEQE